MARSASSCTSPWCGCPACKLEETQRQTAQWMNRCACGHAGAEWGLEFIPTGTYLDVFGVPRFRFAWVCHDCRQREFPF